MLLFSRSFFRFSSYIAATVITAGLAGQALAEHGGPLASVTPEGTLGKYQPQAQATGTFKIRGSDSMNPVLSRLVAEFQRRQPNVAIDIKPIGSNAAIEEFLQPPLHKTGKVMLSEEVPKQFTLMASSRELFDAEIREFESQNGYEPTAVPIAVDAVAVYVHKDNPITGLTLEQIDAMFSTTRLRGHKTPITQWGQLGLSDGWSSAAIQLHGRDRKSGTRSFFKEHCLGGGEFVSSVHESPGAASVILSLSHDQSGIGYSGLGLQSSMVRVVPLAETTGMPFVTPSSSAVADQTYPLRRVLYLYVNKAPQASLSPAVREFLSYIMSHEGQEAVMKAGFFPLPVNQVKGNTVALGSSSGLPSLPQ